MKFSTERLVLRSITEHDAVEILNIRSNPEINRYLQRIPPRNTFEALDFIINIKKKTLDQEIVFMGIRFKDDPKLLGTICLWNFSTDRTTAELGYELLPQFHRKGIMSEAVLLMLHYGFHDLNLKMIEAKTNKNNVGSVKILEKTRFILNGKRSDQKFPDNIIFERSTK